jgi:hypothetical protein
MTGFGLMQKVSSSAVGKGLSCAEIVGIQAVEIAPAFMLDIAPMAVEVSCNFSI